MAGGLIQALSGFVVRGTAKFVGTVNETDTDVAVQPGVASGTPRIVFSIGTTGGVDNWQVDNNNGEFRFYRPAETHLTLSATYATFRNSINIPTGKTYDINGTPHVHAGGGAAKFSASVGDGSATAYVITHSLGTKDVVVGLYDNNTPFAEMECDVEHTSSTTITLRFAAAPALNRYRVTVIG